MSRQAIPITADLEVKSGDLSFRITKDALCAQSGYFKRLLSDGAKETDEGILELHDDDPAHINLLITFLKTGDYNDHQPQPPPSKPSLSTSLDEESTRKRRRTVTTTTTQHTAAVGNRLNRSLSSQLTTISLYALASKYEINNLKRLCLRKFSNIPFEAYLHGTEDVVYQIYNSTPSSDRLLKDTIVKILAEALWDPDRSEGDSEGPTTSELLECVATTPAAMADLLVEATKKIRGVSEGWRWERQARWDMWSAVEKTGRCCDVCGEGEVKVDVGRSDFEGGKVEVVCLRCGGVGIEEEEDEWGGSEGTMEEDEDEGG